MNQYIPAKGDFIALTFDPQAGHEQMGRRPAIVISNDLFNEHTRLAIVCPIINTNRNYPFHITIPDNLSISGYVMVEQVKSIDYFAKKTHFIENDQRQLKLIL